jgi:diacylglycerol kinase family enzyme
MYYYIVDPQNLKQKEFERVQNILYSSLSEFRISGEVVRMTGLRTIAQLVENAFAHEAKTIVAVGSDETLHEVVNAVGKRDMVVGFIPLIESNLAESFGIKDILQAIKTIAFRRIEMIDLGSVNNYYFLSKLNFGLDQNSGIRQFLNAPAFEIQFNANENFQARQTIIGGTIINGRGSDRNKIGNPTDGFLDLILLPPLTKLQTVTNLRKIKLGYYEEVPLCSLLHVKRIQINEPAGLPIKIGSRVVAKAPALIELQPQTLKMIVGRERNF